MSKSNLVFDYLLSKRQQPPAGKELSLRDTNSIAKHIAKFLVSAAKAKDVALVQLVDNEIRTGAISAFIDGVANFYVAKKSIFDCVIRYLVMDSKKTVEGMPVGESEFELLYENMQELKNHSLIHESSGHALHNLKSRYLDDPKFYDENVLSLLFISESLTRIEALTNRPLDQKYNDKFLHVLSAANSHWNSSVMLTNYDSGVEALEEGYNIALYKNIAINVLHHRFQKNVTYNEFHACTNMTFDSLMLPNKNQYLSIASSITSLKYLNHAYGASCKGLNNLESLNTGERVRDLPINSYSQLLSYACTDFVVRRAFFTRLDELLNALSKDFNKVVERDATQGVLKTAFSMLQNETFRTQAFHKNSMVPIQDHDSLGFKVVCDYRFKGLVKFITLELDRLGESPSANALIAQSSTSLPISAITEIVASKKLNIEQVELLVRNFFSVNSRHIESANRTDMNVFSGELSAALKYHYPELPDRDGHSLFDGYIKEYVNNRSLKQVIRTSDTFIGHWRSKAISEIISTAAASQTAPADMSFLQGAKV